MSPVPREGINLLNNVYWSFVLNVYTNAITIHIVGLSLTFALMAIFLLFMLRPYLHEVSSETRRIAFLLSQVHNVWQGSEGHSHTACVMP